MHVISTLGSWIQEDQKLKIILSYIENSKPSWAQETLSQNDNKNVASQQSSLSQHLCSGQRHVLQSAPGWPSMATTPVKASTLTKENCAFTASRPASSILSLERRTHPRCQGLDKNYFTSSTLRLSDLLKG